MAEREFDRRSMRIAGGDYSRPGCYFVTICAAFRRNIFGAIEDGKVVLSPLGEIVRGCWVRIPEHFPTTSINEYVIMPNHLHGIIALGVGARYIVPSDPDGQIKEAFQKPTRGTIPTIVRTFKAAVTRRARSELNTGNGLIWQSNYFERVLRNGREVATAIRYIAENPARWMWDEENAERKKEEKGG
jgi:REP element-mobilizing transposase RayT